MRVARWTTFVRAEREFERGEPREGGEAAIKEKAQVLHTLAILVSGSRRNHRPQLEKGKLIITTAAGLY